MVLEPVQLLSLIAHAAFLVSYPEYQRRGIPDSIFLATFSDIRRWQEKYFQDSGRIGLGERRLHWLKNHITLKLFALGSLQYQYREEPDELNIHIPKGADLSAESVDESLRQAFGFFRKDEITFFCSSWLLSPQLRTLLDENSRIAAFARRFEIISTDYSSRQAEERLFGVVCDDPSSYCNLATSLQNRARTFLIDGGRLPSSEGCFHLCKSEIGL